MIDVPAWSYVIVLWFGIGLGQALSINGNLNNPPLRPVEWLIFLVIGAPVSISVNITRWLRRGSGL